MAQFVPSPTNQQQHQFDRNHNHHQPVVHSPQQTQCMHRSPSPLAPSSLIDEHQIFPSLHQQSIPMHVIDNEANSCQQTENHQAKDTEQEAHVQKQNKSVLKSCTNAKAVVIESDDDSLEILPNPSSNSVRNHCTVRKRRNQCMDTQQPSKRRRLNQPNQDSSDIDENMHEYAADEYSQDEAIDVDAMDDAAMSSQRHMLLAGGVHRDNHRSSTSSSEHAVIKGDPAERECAEKKRLFDIAVKKRCPSLLGNTVWTAGNHGPPGLHKTPSHWCRYCGTRVSKRWAWNGRICYKHLLFITRRKKNIKALLFEDGDPSHGKDVQPDGPLDASQNAELEYLREFAGKADPNRRRRCKKKTKSESSNTNTNMAASQNQGDNVQIKTEPDSDMDLYGVDEDVEDDEECSRVWEVSKIHSRKKLYEERDGEDGRECTFYLIEWEGYRLEDCTWEPMEHLTDCHENLKRFELKIQSKAITDCVDCNIRGWKCYTKPCFKHFGKESHKKIIAEYQKSTIRRLAGIKFTEETVQRYCEENDQ